MYRIFYFQLIVYWDLGYAASKLRSNNQNDHVRIYSGKEIVEMIFKGELRLYSPVPNNRGEGILISISRGGGRGGLKIVRFGNRFSLIMGIASAKFRSVRRVSQPAFICSYLNISHTCLPSHVCASFAFLTFTVFSFQEKWESLHSSLRRD